MDTRIEDNTRRVLVDRLIGPAPAGHLVTALTVVLTLLLGTSGNAATLHVSANGPGDPGPGDPNVSDPLEDGSSSHPFDAIQEAINNALDGDTILVRPGEYTGAGNRNIGLSSKEIEIRGQAGAATIIINCEGAGRGLYNNASSSKPKVIEGITIENAYIDGKGAGFYCTTGDTVIRNCIIRNCRASGDGGGIYFSSFKNASRLAVESCIIENNRAHQGGGLYVSGPIQITGSDITQNTAPHYGGGLYVSGRIRMTESNIAQNKTAWFGGGLYFRWGSSGSVQACRIENNSAYEGGGGVFCGRTSPRIDRCLIANNTSVDNYGGGLYLDTDCRAYIESCLIVGSTAGGGGRVGKRSTLPQRQIHSELLYCVGQQRHSRSLQQFLRSG